MLYRPYTLADQDLFIHLVNNLWCFEKMCPNDAATKMLSVLATYDMLSMSNCSVVLEYYDATGAMLLARVSPTLIPQLQNCLYTNNDAITASIFASLTTPARTCRIQLQELYSQELASYNQVMHEFNELQQLIPCQGNEQVAQLTWFTANPLFKGHGLGTALLEHTLAAFQQVGIHTIYLLTDEQCSYQYYDKHGFSCIAKRQSKLHFADHTDCNQVFLYQKQL